MKLLWPFFLSVPLILLSCDYNNDNKNNFKLLTYFIINENESKIWKDTSIKLTIQEFGGMPLPSGTYYYKESTYNKEDLTIEQLTILKKMKKASVSCCYMCADCVSSVIIIYDEDGSMTEYYDNFMPCNALEQFFNT